MSLYPSLEDMQVDKLVQSQRAVVHEVMKNEMEQSSPGLMLASNDSEVYPALGNFLGLELSDEMIRVNMPEYLRDCSDSSNNMALQSSAYTSAGVGGGNSVLIAPVTGNSTVSSRAQVTHTIRELILCKGTNGKVGLRVQAIDNGIFVCIVAKNSPAALAGLRFGDQILQLNGQLVAGYSVDKIHKMLKKSDKNNISVIIRDRPFERTITLLKDSKGGLGFQFKNGKITAIVKDSSAARNGVLTNHNLLEVNGQTVVALKDKEITKIINEATENAVKITIVPTFIFEHLVKKLSTSFLRGIMDHSIPEF